MSMIQAPWDGASAVKPGQRLQPGWAICQSQKPHGCNGRFQYPKSLTYFSKSQLNGKAHSRTCLKCQELGLTWNQLAALKSAREQGVIAAATA
eukprot:43644-Eustigmatos_ZCMA.PRE.1